MPAAIPKEERPYEIVVWGATGFTGSLVAQYLAGGTGRSGNPGGAAPLKWAIGGRTQAKLNAVKAALKVNPQVAAEPDILIADSDDLPSLQRMTAQTRLVLSTVGPFARVGEPLIAACAKTGTDYTDITGESPWVAEMMQKYNEMATKNNALIVNMSGFDSVPADICAFMAANWLREKKNLSTGHLQGYATVKGGGVSGGTIASMLYSMEKPKVPGESHPGAQTMKAYLLNPKEQTPPRTRPEEREQLLPYYDRTIKRWTAPFIMALVNTRVVRRSLALRRALERESDGFGSDATYNECMPAPSIIHAFFIWLGLAIFALLLAIPPTRYVLKRFLPAPGEGPSAEKRAATRFTYRVIGRGSRPDDEGRGGPLASDTMVEASMQGGDPGYTDTALMISELSLLIARDRSKLPIQTLVQGRSAVQGPAGGFYTPSLVGGQLLVDRLRQAGLKLSVGEFKGGAAALKAD